LTTVGGTAEVSAYGSSSEYCKVASWGTASSGTDVNVRCFSTAGTPADTLFSLSYGHTTTHGGSSYGYIWSGGGVYQGSQIDSPLTAAHPGVGSISISRTGTGAYTVIFPQLNALLSSVKVTAYGTGPESCKVVGTRDNQDFTTLNPGTVVWVQCFSASGSPADSAYTLAYATDALDEWSPFTSEEFAPALCNGNSGVRGARCTGSFCDNVGLLCGDLAGSGYVLDHSRDYWTPFFSEEGANTTVETCGLTCRQRQLNQEFCDGIVTGIGCSGSYCDNVRLRCSPFSSAGVSTSGCFWTASFSEEQGSEVFPSDHFYVATGAQCTGSNCDNMSFFVCPSF
jgi:hypothetical protein